MNIYETDELKKFKSNTTGYLLLKLAATRKKHILSDLQCFIESPNVSSNPSVIHYMEIINENADSNETMLKVAEDLNRGFQDTLTKMDSTS